MDLSQFKIINRVMEKLPLTPFKFSPNGIFPAYFHFCHFECSKQKPKLNASSAGIKSSSAKLRGV